MSPTILQIVLNAGKLISTLKDLEKTVSDAVAKNNVTADVKQDLTDLVNLCLAGFLVIPGITTAQLQQALTDIQAIV